MPDATKKKLPNAYLNQNKTTVATADLLKVIDLGITSDDLVSTAAVAAFGALWLGKDQIGAKAVLTKFTAALGLVSNEFAPEIALRFLSSLASPEMKGAWTIAWQSLAANLKPEAAEAIRFLEPVCSVLEGKNRTLLDALPPEQREFALEVLAKFEPKPEPSLAKPQKTSYRKRIRTGDSTVHSSVNTKAP